MDVKTFYDEILAAIIVPEGETALVGAPIGLLAETQDEVAEAKAKAKAACSSTAPQTVNLTPPPATATPPPAIKSLLNGLSNVQVYLTTWRGMAKRARVAAYKVCWIGGCFSTDILAAIDKEIEDGVNVMSMSLGGGTSDFYRDSMAISAFAAMEKGILISCSAGNAGPSWYNLSNVASWITTVGASTLDRDFPAYASIGNGQNYSGVSLYRGSELSGKLLPLIYAANASNSTNGNLCMMDAGGAGMVLSNTAANGEELVADAHLLPATSVGQKSGDAIKKYISTESDPTVTILFEGTKVGVKPSPVVATFSSRGPNSITPNILKLDLITLGVNILASSVIKRVKWSLNIVLSGLLTWLTESCTAN
ncbi:Peptidase_S8 domain-containing protein [Cephalotus follicularis]|uniref:Peptidase_S8 domain-containing protein n=1 Tax=Cephalotus follicularis TaxID=3775 RepID=A0A1Q3C6L5_CEPFO|nr:Peptidase_S8 domain-containing protein [Cephalotus follicularis]